MHDPTVKRDYDILRCNYCLSIHCKHTNKKIETVIIENKELSRKLEIAKEGLIQLARASQSLPVNEFVYDIFKKIEGAE